MKCPSCSGNLINIYMKYGNIYERIQGKYICEGCERIIKHEYKELQ